MEGACVSRLKLTNTLPLTPHLNQGALSAETAVPWSTPFRVSQAQNTTLHLTSGTSPWQSSLSGPPPERCEDM